jgi:hypothetical protein
MAEPRQRLVDLLDYIEQVVRLDERVSFRLSGSENLAHGVDHYRPRVDRDARSKCGLTRARILAVQVAERTLDG